MLKKIVYLLAIAMLLGGMSSVRAQRATDVVMVLPIENTSDKSEFNWVGESFALSLSELLKVPGLRVISNSERKIIQQRLRIPLTNLRSLATSLKLARESGATHLIAGRYAIFPAQGEVAATINVRVQVIVVNEGRFLNEVFNDGSQKTREVNVTDALNNLQTIQGQVAFQILYQRDKALPFSGNDLIIAASKV